MYKDETSGNYLEYKKMMANSCDWKYREQVMNEQTGIEYHHGIKVKGIDKKGYKFKAEYLGAPVGTTKTFTVPAGNALRNAFFYDSITPIANVPFILPSGDIYFELIFSNFVNVDPQYINFGVTLNTLSLDVLDHRTTPIIDPIFRQPNIWYNNGSGIFHSRSLNVSNPILDQKQLSPFMISDGDKICLKIDSKFNLFFGYSYDTLSMILNIKNAIMASEPFSNSCNLRAFLSFSPSSAAIASIDIKNVASGYTPPLIIEEPIRTKAGGPIDLSAAAGTITYLLDYSDLFVPNSIYGFPSDWGLSYKRDSTSNVQFMIGFLKSGFTVTTFTSIATGIKPQGVIKGSLLKSDYELCIDENGNIWDIDVGIVVMSPQIPNTLGSEFFLGCKVIDSTRCSLQIGSSKSQWRYEKIELISNLYGIGASTTGAVVLSSIPNK